MNQVRESSIFPTTTNSFENKKLRNEFNFAKVSALFLLIISAKFSFCKVSLQKFYAKFSFLSTLLSKGFLVEKVSGDFDIFVFFSLF